MKKFYKLCSEGYREPNQKLRRLIERFGFILKANPLFVKDELRVTLEIGRREGALVFTIDQIRNKTEIDRVFSTQKSYEWDDLAEQMESAQKLCEELNKLDLIDYLE